MPRVEGVTWKEYETGLEEKLTQLQSQIPRGCVDRSFQESVHPDADGRQGPLGIKCLQALADFPNAAADVCAQYAATLHVPYLHSLCWRDQPFAPLFRICEVIEKSDEAKNPGGTS